MKQVPTINLDFIQIKTKADYAHILLKGMMSGVKKLQVMRLIIKKTKSTYGKIKKDSKKKKNQIIQQQIKDQQQKLQTD